MQTEEAAGSVGTDRVICGLPVDTGILFSDKKGIYKPRIEKDRTKLLARLGFLARFLEADEKILLVTSECSPFTALEQLTIGAARVVALKRAVFVFTNKRLFHIPVTTSLKCRGSIAQVLYQDCRWNRPNRCRRPRHPRESPAPRTSSPCAEFRRLARGRFRKERGRWPPSGSGSMGSGLIRTAATARIAH